MEKMEEGKNNKKMRRKNRTVMKRPDCFWCFGSDISFLPHKLRRVPYERSLK
jgi:hypothetical protein